jgi:hypothetical protein
MQVKFELDFKIDLISALILKLNWFQVWFQNWNQSCFQNQIDLRNQIKLVIMISKIVQTASIGIILAFYRISHDKKQKLLIFSKKKKILIWFKIHCFVLI